MSSWVTKVLTVLSEYKNQEGVLRHRWEIIQPTNEETGKHFAPALQKTGFYQKDGELKRGYAQAFTIYDLNYVKNNWDNILAALTPAPKTAAPKAAEAPPSAEIDEVPF